MPLYAAIDLHSTNSMLAVLDETDKPLRQCRLPNDLAQILAELEPFRADVVGVAVESTYNWYWLVDGLADHGYPMRLVNTAAVPQYDGLKYSGDESDARHLAHLMRLGILPVGYIYPREGRVIRDLLRQRFVLVRQGVSAMQRVQGAWARHTGQCLSANAFRKLTDEDLRQAFPDPCVRMTVGTQQRVWRNLEEQVHQVEKQVLAMRPYPRERTALTSTPGIGPILGLTITLETGDIARFADVGNYVSYCRLVKSERVSNGKKKGEGNRKCGNKYLSWAWIEAANFATRYSPSIKRWYDRKAAKRRRVIAIKAVAHKLARAGYYLMRDGGKFEVARAFG
jgi:transposase